MTSYGPIDHPIWGTQPADGWAAELNVPLTGITLGSYDVEIIRWAARTLDGPTLRVIVSLLHRARAAEPLAGDEQIGGDSQTSRIAKPSEHEGDYEASVEGQ